MFKPNYAFVSLLFMFIGFQPSYSYAEDSAALNVAVDIAPLHSLVSQVMDGVGSPDILIPPAASPHGYSLKPSDAEILQNADLVIFMGDALTPWLIGPIENLSPDSVKIDLLTHDETLIWNQRENAIFAGEDHHDEHEHEHGAIDPHAWLSVENAQIWVQIIADELSALDAQNAERYKDNAQAAQARLSTLKHTIHEILDPLKDQDFVVFHDSFQYFEREFDVMAQGSILISDATPPSPARIVELAEAIEENGIACILTEPQFNPNLIEALSDKTQLHTNIIDPLGSTLPLGVAQYAQLIENIAQSLSQCLKDK